MIHARKDYDRIQDPARIIPADEPVFLLRGQDRCAIGAIETWCRQAEILGVEQSMIDAAREHAKLMEIWQKEKFRRVPDMPADAYRTKPLE